MAETDGIDTADEFLANYFSPTWVDERINWLKFIKGFQERFGVAQLALEDYKAGRFYASVLTTLSLSRRRKITFPIRSMLAKQVGYDQVYRRTASL